MAVSLLDLPGQPMHPPNFVFPKLEFGKKLNHLLLLHAHKQLTDSIDLIAVANELVVLSEHRLSLFGKFRCSSTSTKRTTGQVSTILSV